MKQFGDNVIWDLFEAELLFNELEWCHMKPTYGKIRFIFMLCSRGNYYKVVHL
jgi:hypothetical protein